MVQAALITAIYDRYDDLKDVCPQTVDTEWICVTDDEALHRGDADPRGWSIVYEPRPGLHPNRAAKRPKMLPHEYTAAPASVWVDASFAVVSPLAVDELLAHAAPVAQFAHPERQCLFDEANVCLPLGKYAGEPMAEQVTSYRHAGMPDRWGLWATGVIARQHTPAVADWGKAWAAEIDAWSFQDQLSHPWVSWALDMRPTDLPGTHTRNPWLHYRGSGRH